MTSYSGSAGGAGRDSGAAGLAPARLALACVAATLAFLAYTQTLLPGVDLGDTGGFQAAVLWPETSARRAYPLYYALARPFVAAVSAANPARGLNLFSALWAAIAVGVLAWVAARVLRSLLAGAAAALLLAFSYTFWTQAIIAEVYSLHLAIVAACLAALAAFERHPTTSRLAVFFVVYAVGFGNHLSMILLLIPFTVFLLQVHPRRRELFRPAVILLAAAAAIAGALQYTGEFLSVWTSIEAPAAVADRVAAFWFDTTKADWRASMVLGVEESEWRSRLAMWAWDARQQFGLAGLALALTGAVRLWFITRRWALLVWLAFAASTIFALTYNVGDTHVFFLPGHLLTAFAAGAAVAWPAERARIRRGMLVTVAAALVLAYSGWRAWDTWPAVDRHDDRRADALVSRITQGLNGQSAVLATVMDWQSENALLYSARYERPTLAWTRLGGIMLHFPFFVADNHDIGRDVVLTTDAAASVLAAFGPAFPIVRDEPSPLPFSDIVRRLPKGSPYVLTFLAPPRDEHFDPDDFETGLAVLAAQASPSQNAQYELWAGQAGEAAAVHRASARPFRTDLTLLGDAFTVRMDSWLPFDTFRRGGFGHVIRGREPVLTIERGVSLVWFRTDGSPSVVYAGGLYAPEARYRIPSGATLGLAALPH